MVRDAVLERASSQIGLKPIFEFEGQEIHVVLIAPWTPPLIAKWWRGKSASIIAADVDGNFFLHHCDGSVRYYVHFQKSEKVVTKSFKDFVAALREDHNGSIEWWKKEHSDADT